MREQLEQIYRDHRRGLFALALCVTGCRVMAEDAVHDAFVRLCRSPSKPDGDLQNYVFASVRNAARDARRKRHRNPEVASELFDDSEPGESSELQPQEQLQRAEEQQALQKAILKLEPEAQEAVILKIHGGLTFDAIGEVTGERPATVATRYRRALETLQQRLKDQK